MLPPEWQTSRDSSFVAAKAKLSLLGLLFPDVSSDSSVALSHDCRGCVTLGIPHNLSSKIDKLLPFNLTIRTADLRKLQTIASLRQHQ